MAICTGNFDDHCCWMPNGKPCLHLEEDTVPGRRWACGLLRTLGTWDAVYKSEEWQRDAKPLCDLIGVRCGSWPPKGRTCATCGVDG